MIPIIRAVRRIPPNIIRNECSSKKDPLFILAESIACSVTPYSFHAFITIQIFEANNNTDGTAKNKNNGTALNDL